MTQPFELPVDSPLAPQKLSADTKIKFSCHKGISCFNECCRHADITLTPYDIIRMKKNLGLTSTEFLEKYTVPFEMDADGMPGVKLRTENEKPVCLLVTDEGCSVYEDRPTACRYYPVGLMTMRKQDEYTEHEDFFVVQEDHCMGHKEDNELTISEYRKEQGVEEYDQLTFDWRQIVLKKRSLGPSVGKPSKTSFQFFFLCSYDVDRFRQFVETDGFKKSYDLPEAEYQKLLDDDIELMKFGHRLMKQTFFGEESINLKQGAREQRIEERKGVWGERIEAERELYKAKNDVYESSCDKDCND